MEKNFLTLLLLTFSLSIFSLPIFAEANIKWLKGTVTKNDKVLKVGASVQVGDRLKTAKKSFVRINFTQALITLGPASELIVEAPKKEEKSLTKKLISGAARFIHTSDKPLSGEGIVTPHASMGVRGTDFLAKVNLNLGETEIVLFDGKVKMVNLGDSSDQVDINPGQWGGIGGRFGEKLKTPITLPKKVLKGFEKLLK